MARPVVHWEIAGRDTSALREFYAKAFGWTITDAGPTYALVQPVGGGLDGGIMRAPGQSPPYVTIYVRVDDLDAALAEIGALGGTPLVPPTAINEAASFAMFRDPEGNVVGLLKQTAPIHRLSRSPGAGGGSGVNAPGGCVGSGACPERGRARETVTVRLCGQPQGVAGCRRDRRARHGGVDGQ